MGALLSTLGLTALVVAAAVLCGAAAAYSAALRFPAPKQGHGLPAAEMPRVLRSAAVLTMAALLFFQSGIEFTLGGFISTYLIRAQNASVTEASWALSAYWASLLAARLVLSRILLRVPAANLTIVCALVAAAGAAGAALAHSFAVAAAAVAVTGFALAGIYPAVLAVAGARFREHSGTVFGILFTVALIGGMTIPWLAGNMAESNVRSVFYLVAASFCAVAALAGVVRKTGE
jgi:fucose permease